MDHLAEGFRSAQSDLQGIVLYNFLTYFYFDPNGISTFTKEVVLDRNSLIDTFDLEVFADRADWAQIGAVGQARIHLQESEQITMIVDFGMPLTVGGIGIAAVDGTDGLVVTGVYPWQGTKFSSRGLTGSSSGTKLATFPAEVATARLMIKVKPPTSAPSDLDAFLAEVICVQLPSLPAGLELTIDDGPAVWTHPGLVQSGQDGWVRRQSDGRTVKTVSLAEPLAPFVGDPEDESPITIKLTLRATIPGRLELGDPTRAIRHLKATDLGAEKKVELEFAEEGYVDLPVSLPTGATTPDELRLEVSGELPPERIVPPVGPPIKANAELVLDPDHAFCLRLPSGSGLTELTGIRLPLTAGADGAEAAIVLYENLVAPAESTGIPDQPGDAMDGVASPAVLVSSSGSTADDWVTFTFEKPVTIQEDQLPWVGLLLNRGEAQLSVAENTAAWATEIRRGPPSGPWQQLPAIFADSGSFPVAGRLRLVGCAAPKQPVAPIMVELSGDEAPWLEEAVRAAVLPAKADTSVSWKPGAGWTPGTGALSLRVTSRALGSITVRNLTTIAVKP